jgi:restriction system protein
VEVDSIPGGLCQMSGYLSQQTSYSAVPSLLDGRFIEAIVSSLGLKSSALYKENPEQAFELPWDRSEEVVAGAYKRASVEEGTLTPRSGDHGRDVIATKEISFRLRSIGAVQRAPRER